MSWFQTIAMVTGYIVIAIILTYIIWKIASKIWDFVIDRKNKEEDRNINFIRTVKSFEIIRWCGYEFPIVKDTLDYLYKNKEAPFTSMSSVSDFRAYLRQKYPECNKHPEE